jgi:hypothetical protein
MLPFLIIYGIIGILALVLLGVLVLGLIIAAGWGLWFLIEGGFGDSDDFNPFE